jgi:hypothetical protein
VAPDFQIHGEGKHVVSAQSPLGHKVKSLTSVSARGPLLSHTKVRDEAVGFISLLASIRR